MSIGLFCSILVDFVVAVVICVGDDHDRVGDDHDRGGDDHDCGGDGDDAQFSSGDQMLIAINF